MLNVGRFQYTEALESYGNLRSNLYINQRAIYIIIFFVTISTFILQETRLILYKQFSLWNNISKVG